MSDFAFFRFMSGNMLTKEEQEHKDEIIELTEEILHAKGLQCDASIAKISEKQLEEILGKVRELRKKRKKACGTNIVVIEYDENDQQKGEIPIV
jgi:hypothetical protein